MEPLAPLVGFIGVVETVIVGQVILQLLERLSAGGVPVQPTGLVDVTVLV